MRSRPVFFRVRLLAVLGLWGVPLAGCGSVEDPPGSCLEQLDAEWQGPAEEVRPYWEALVAESSGPIAVEWNADTGTPRTLYGMLSAPAGEASEARAVGF